MEDSLWAPYLYLEGIPGKNLRSDYIDAFNSVLQAPPNVVTGIKDIVNRLHTTSLLMDDIEDGAVLRRGRPVAHSIFGVPRTMNTANFAMITTLQAACTKFPEVQSIFYDELLTLHRGQGNELYWRDTHTCPTENEYKQMVLAKTGGLYRLAVRVLQHYAPAKPDLVPLANCLALLFQIQDDYLNLISSMYEENKGFAEDITEGKFSFPVIHSLGSGSRRAVELKNILQLHTQDVFLKKHALNILETTGSLAHTQAVIAEYVDEAHQLISGAGLADPSALYELVQRIVQIDRK